MDRTHLSNLQSDLRARVRRLAEAGLAVRGQAGRAAAAWLEDPESEAARGIAARLRLALPALAGDGPVDEVEGDRPEPAAGPASARDRVAIDLPRAERIFLLGDLHGRWDLARQALFRAGATLAGGAWAAGPGAILVQLGDVIDADTAARFPAREDPRGDRLAAAFADDVREALAASRVSDAERESLEHGFLRPAPADPDATVARARHRLAGAALSLRSLQGLRSLAASAAAAGSRAVTILGNHEVDLLSGRLHFFGEQKRLLLRLLGLDADDAVRVLREARSREAIEPVLAAAPELAWMAALPLIVRAGPVLAMHGGPTRAATDELEARSLSGIRDLGEWLSPLGLCAFNDDALAEGRSILSPARAGDDVVGDRSLLEPWLCAARADFLALGHSPFLGFPAGAWLELEDPRVRARARRVEALGAFQDVWKLDADLKRGGSAEVVRLDLRAGTAEVIDSEGRARHLLLPGRSLAPPPAGWRAILETRRLLRAIDADRPATLADLAGHGVDAREVGGIFATLERIAGREPAAADEAQRHLAYLLNAGPADPRPLALRLLGWEAGDPTALAALAAHRRAVEGRADAIAADHADVAGDAVRVVVDPRACVVEGGRYTLVLPVVERLRAVREERGLPPLPAIAAALVLAKGRPAVALSLFDLRGRLVSDDVRAAPDEVRDLDALDRWARTLLRETAPSQPRAPVEDGAGWTSPAPGDAPGARRPASWPAIPRAALAALLDASADLLRTRCRPGDPLPTADAARCAHLVAPGGELRPGWVALEGPWPRLRAVLTPQRVLVLADTVFWDPSAAPRAVRIGADGAIELLSAADALASHLSGDPVRLYAHLKPEVAAALAAGEVERLGVGLGAARGEAPWRGGCWLFLTPAPTAAAMFAALNPVPAVFEVPRAVLRALIDSRLVAVSAFTGDGGESLDPAASLGARDVAIEVVALGHEGVAAMAGWRVPWPLAPGS